MLLTPRAPLAAEALATPNAAPATTITVAMLQMLQSGSDKAANLEKADRFCRDAAAQGADIALFPEMWSIGYTQFHGLDAATVRTWQAQAEPKDGPWVQHFAKLADELDMAIAVTYLQQWDGAPRNALTLFDRHGKEVLDFAKVHTTDFANFEASTTPGDAWPVATLDTEAGPVRVGAMICFDREFPESARSLMVNGAELVLTPNACLLDDLRIMQFRVRAMENAMAVVMTNYPAPFNNGRSVAFDAAATPLIESGPDEGIYLAHIDLAAVRRWRERVIWGTAYRRPHRYTALTEPRMLPEFQRQSPFGGPYDPNLR